MKYILKWIRGATLKDWLGLFRKAVPHIAIVISGMLIVFFVIDRINKPMGFMTNEFHKVITFILSVIAIGMAMRLTADRRQRERNAYKQALRKAKESAAKAPTGRKQP